MRISFEVDVFQTNAANGSAKTMLAPNEFGSPCDVSMPIMRAMPMRYV